MNHIDYTVGSLLPGCLSGVIAKENGNESPLAISCEVCC